MDPATEAEFVIFGGRLKSGAFGYANHNGDFVPIDRAKLWDHRTAMRCARDLAASIQANVFVAPLLFGLPDEESIEMVSPERS